MHAIFLLVLSVTVVMGATTKTDRIIGGIVTPIERYPFTTGLLYSWDSSIFYFLCGGSIINNRNILTAAHCIFEDPANRLRVRVGSHLVNSGGVVHVVESTASHASHDRPYLDNDIAVIRTALPITYVDNVIQPALFAGANYIVPDNAVVWAVGWGHTSHQGQPSEELIHAQIWAINQDICAQRYTEIGYGVTANMLCAGWLDMGGRGQCNGDSGGPLVHNGVVVGITAWSYECALGRYPTVNMRVSRYTDWIRAHMI